MGGFGVLLASFQDAIVFYPKTQGVALRALPWANLLRPFRAKRGKVFFPAKLKKDRGGASPRLRAALRPWEDMPGGGVLRRFVFAGGWKPPLHEV